MALDPFTAVIDLANGVGGKLIDKLFPDKVAQAEERAKAELAMAQVVQAGDIQMMQQQMSAIIAEANSTDPWTSRARPSFMYVMYVMILAAIPMGIVSAINPNAAVQIAAGFKSWLGAIPDSLWVVFGTGYLGYVGAKTYEKQTQIKVNNSGGQ